VRHRQRANGTAAEQLIPFRIGPLALLLIFGFWTMFAVATAANELMSPFRPRPFRGDLVALTFLGAYLWAALTPLALWFISWYSLEQGNRARRVVLYILLAGVLALLVSSALALVGSQLFNPPGQPPQLADVGLAPRRRALGRALLVLIRFRFLTDLVASLLVLAAGLAYDYFQRFQARQAEAILLREQLVESRLQVLRTQLNPHFLFNTLNAVSGLVAKDPSGVRRMIARLSDVLRYSLDGAHEQEIRLEKELDILHRYLEILEIRYQGRLVTEVRAEPDVLDALVPTLILQPLAENAMTHGVGRAGGYGRIEVHARRAGDELVVTVRDTGAGVEAEAAPPQGGGRAEAPGGDARSGHPDDRAGLGGIGLRHIRQRLEQLYGSAYRLELHPHPEGGTVAELALPYHTGTSAVAKEALERV
jgi:two-component system LytT family sensor kinase